ncbi:MAG: Phenylacetic acid catabolic protein [Geodermatophilaceae bacterium]
MTATATDATDHDNVYDGLLGRRRRPAVGVRHRASTDPLAGVDTTVARRRRPADLAAYCLMLGDDALVCSPPALRSGAATRPTSRRTSRWPTSRSTCSARPGCCSPAPRPPTRRSCRRCPTGSPVPAEDALAFFRDEREFRNVRLVEPRQRRLRRARSPGCCCSRPGAWRCCSACAASRDPVLAAVAAKGVKELTYHRDYAGPLVPAPSRGGTEESRRRLRRRRSPPCGRCVDELFRSHPTSSGRWPSRASASTPRTVRRRGRRAPRAGALGQRRSTAPTCAAAGTVAGRSGRDGRHTEALGRCSPRCRSSPARTRTGRGDTVADASGATARSGRGRGDRPRDADAHAGRPRRAARRRASTATARSSVTITPTYSGCPAMATMRDDLVHRLRDAGLRATSTCGSACARPGPATGSPTRGRRSARRPRHRPARRRRRPRDGPVPLTAGADPARR